MRALLDVNVLIPLLDPDHAYHVRSHNWWEANAKTGWASSPLTENGVVRIMSNPSYSKTTRFSPSQLIEHLEQFADQTDHEFWPDDISLRNSALFTRDNMHSSRTITDVYLLALSTKYRGRLATFDQGILISTVRGATPQNLCVI